MPSREATKLLIGLVLAPLIGWLWTLKRRSRKLMWMLTAILLSIGTTSIVTERFAGKSGSRLATGRSAIVIGAVLVGVGIYFALALVKSRSAQAPSND